MTDQNAQMRLTLDTKVVGSKVTAFRIEGRAVVIEFDSGYSSYFTVVEHFDLHGPGKWAFVPNPDPGRPARGTTQAGCVLCGVAIGGQHRPSCDRQGMVTGESLL